jgi:plasmid maintenance system antidote protein VapI
MEQQEKTENLHDYNPNRLIDALILRKALKNDAALCRFLQVSPPLISRIRHGKLKVSGDVMIRMHEAFDMPIAELRQLIGTTPQV